MRVLFAVALLSMTFLNVSFAQVKETVSGTVIVKGKAPKGVLYIFAKKYNSKMPMPLAVKKIESPKYPVKFELSKKDAMMRNFPFEGPFKITARVSPSGDASDKSGKEVSTIKAVNLGDSNIKLVFE